jgi:hypothetical protein
LESRHTYHSVLLEAGWRSNNIALPTCIIECDNHALHAFECRQRTATGPKQAQLPHTHWYITAGLDSLLTNQ